MIPSNLHARARRWTPLARAAETRAALAALRAQHREDLRRLVHDLRNPVNSILLMAQLLEEVGSEEVARLARRIQNQCEDLARLASRVVEGLPD